MRAGKAGFFTEVAVGINARLGQEVPRHQVPGGGTGTAEGDGQLAGPLFQVLQGLDGQVGACNELGMKLGVSLPLGDSLRSRILEPGLNAGEPAEECDL